VWVVPEAATQGRWSLLPSSLLELLLLIGVLKVFDCISATVHLLTSGIKLLAGVIPPMLGHTEAEISDLQLMVLVWRRKCTTVEKCILMLELFKLMWDGGVCWGLIPRVPRDASYDPSS
jgi:hypothetical protein